MQEKTTRDTIRDIIAEQLGITNMADYGDDTNLQSELGADSLDKVEIVMAIEEYLGHEITDEESEKLHTIEDWIKFAEEAKQQ